VTTNSGILGQSTTSTTVLSPPSSQLHRRSLSTDAVTNRDSPI